jgi:hypothetical protein
LSIGGERSGTNFEITFDPNLPGLRTATVSIASDDPAHPIFTFAISGFGGPTKPISQTITFAPTATLYLGQSPFALDAYSSSGLPVDFRVISGPATVSGSTSILTGTGTVKLEATQAGCGNYSAGRGRDGVKLAAHQAIRDINQGANGPTGSRTRRFS